MTSTADRRVVILLTTIGADADASIIAETLVNEQLAACVNVLPVMTSVYRWKGQVEHDQEQQLVIKTSQEQVEALSARLRELHPYELPEMILLEGTAGEAYAAWLRESTARSG